MNIALRNNLDWDDINSFCESHSRYCEYDPKMKAFTKLKSSPNLEFQSKKGDLT